MAALSWNEIRQRAIQFSRDWKNVREERAEAQTFWNEFFQVFGIKRRTVAAFEEPVRSLKNTYSRIDLFWPGRLLVEHKSASQDLSEAQSQAFQYIAQLASDGRQDEIPRYVIVSNFHHVALYDLEPDEQLELPLWRGQQAQTIQFHLKDFHQNIKQFAFIVGQRIRRFGEDDQANLKAVSIMADLHDAVKKGFYPAASLERLLVRILFCLFADDTGIHDLAQFEMFIENKTREDGSDLGPQLLAVFEVLDTPTKKRPKHLDEDLNAFPYVNGQLFKERLPLPAFNREMRTQLLIACRFDWSRISPAIFGSLFQGILDAKERRQIGAHYTSERNILRLIRPLFLDDLQSEFEKIKQDRSKRREARLHEFHQKLSRLKFLDPACGCGNFLVVAYRELRRLEHEVLALRFNFDDHVEAFSSDELAKLSQVDVDQFYGIEIGEWPARIAETAMWLTDHQMNTELSLATGNVFQRIPLRASPHILCGNALRIDWNKLLPASECSYVLGNPPFVGGKFQTAEQKRDLERVAGEIKNHGLLDYVSLWHLRAIDYINRTDAKCAFVSTNSICQGEQVGILWSAMFNHGAKIQFAHRTFAWQSEAKGKAHVHVVIVGFGSADTSPKTIYEYDDINGEPVARLVNNINPFLVEGPDITIANRQAPLSNAPEMRFGNQPIDGGHLILDSDERRALISEAPEAEEYLRPYLGAQEFINGGERWCIWLKDAKPNAFRGIEPLADRIEAVREFRLASKRQATKDLAAKPYRFAFISHADADYLLIPSVSSERRHYIPIGFMPANVIASNLCLIVPNATLYHFGVIISRMHMAWVRYVCGRLKSDFRYSVNLVYNNFPWPERPLIRRHQEVESLSQDLLKIRQTYLDGLSTLADLYDPAYTPDPLLKAHQALDRAVDRCYRAERFTTENERIEFLFQLYERLAFPLAPSEPVKLRRQPSKRTPSKE